ncbi:MAG: hypothetical protein O3A72_04445 [Proteobacteria bacterium]|nr:hypothetical protein [Pseudomonadota bacterium]
MTQADSSLYHHFYRRGLTTSRRQFSKQWLAAADNYLCLRGDRGPSADVLVGLFQRLWCERRLMLAVHVGWSILWMKPESRR